MFVCCVCVCVRGVCVLSQLSVCFSHRYVVVPTGAGPAVSVGHTCTYLSSSDAGKGRIVIVGGANPEGSFSDSYMINLGSALTPACCMTRVQITV